MTAREGTGDSGGEAASLREAPLPQTPSPEERLAIELDASSELVPPESLGAPISLAVVTAADRAAATVRGWGVFSVMRVTAHDSSFCGGSPLEVSALWIKHKQKHAGQNGCQSILPCRVFSFYAAMVSAALSAAETLTKSIRDQPISQAEPSKKKGVP